MYTCGECVVCVGGGGGGDRVIRTIPIPLLQKKSSCSFHCYHSIETCSCESGLFMGPVANRKLHYPQ